MYFQYESNGTPLGFIWNVTHLYLTNQMGDVISITDTAGALVANYEYSAWGKVLTADSSIAQQNPLRYRGYYYDNETEYYYLQSRYYDSNICRFINADAYKYAQRLKDDSAGLNLFAYCCNDPINNTDYFGTAKIHTLIAGLIIDVAISVMNPGVAATYDTLGNILKSYFRSKGKKYAVNYIKKEIVPVVTHSFMNNVLTGIKKAVYKVCGATLNNLGGTAMSGVFSCYKKIIYGKNYKGLSIADLIPMLFSIGSLISGILDWISDGNLNNKIRIPFVKGWMNILN